MPKDRDTRKPKGFAFCQYKRKEDAEDAIKGMNGRVSSVVTNKECLVLKSNEQRSNFAWLYKVLITLSKGVLTLNLDRLEFTPPKVDGVKLINHDAH